MKIDIVIDGSFGDCGKGKVVHHLLKTGNYTHCLRGSAGNNCGHTIYHNGKKFITHSIPAGVFFGVKSIIGSGCVVNPTHLLSEIKYLTDNGIDCNKIIKVAYNAHIITEKHIAEDALDTKIGTTKRGIGQAYRDKYSRNGIRAENISELKEYLCDLYDEIFNAKSEPNIIYEGAQGFGLDIDHGDYPYVTSSHTTVAGALLNGIPHTAINNVYLVCKAYETYVGLKKFQPDNNQDLIKIQKLGNEVGATTNRVRQCNYLNITTLKKAVQINAASHIIINKMDILQKSEVWKIIANNEILDLKSEDKFVDYIKEQFKEIPNIHFSYSPEKI